MFFRGQQTAALLIFAFESTVLALYWWIYLFRHKGNDSREGGDSAA